MFSLVNLQAIASPEGHFTGFALEEFQVVVLVVVVVVLVVSRRSFVFFQISAVVTTTRPFNSVLFLVL